MNKQNLPDAMPRTWSRRSGQRWLTGFWLATIAVFIGVVWSPFHKWQTQRNASERAGIIFVACEFATHSWEGEPDGVLKYNFRLNDFAPYTVTRLDANHARVKFQLHGSPDFPSLAPELIEVMLSCDRDGYWRGLSTVKTRIQKAV